MDRGAALVLEGNARHKAGVAVHAVLDVHEASVGQEDVVRAHHSSDGVSAFVLAEEGVGRGVFHFVFEVVLKSKGFRLFRAVFVGYALGLVVRC